MLVQGTIRADIDETVGGIKTQHNVLEQIGINPMERYGLEVVEPLLTLYKQQVRLVARYLGLPSEFSERQPFPGPGLSIRVVGEIHPRKLEIIKEATVIVEKHLKVHTPSQYFAFIIDNNQTKLPLNTTKFKEHAANTFGSSIDNVFLKLFTSRATGIKEGKRQYGGIVGVKVDAGNGRICPIPIQKMTVLQSKLQSDDPPVTRVLYAIKDRGEHRPYVVGIRAVQTQNFLTAKVSDIPRETLVEAAEKILIECHDVSSVYYDVTPKPPATIEME
jgi:GMP synthase (glutamine-hydrolysing)